MLMFDCGAQSISYPCVGLAPCDMNQCTAAMAPAVKYPLNKQGGLAVKEKDKKMSRIEEVYNDVTVDVQAPKSDAATAREYLLNRLSNVSWKKIDELKRHFHLIDDTRPKGIDEFVERIKSGKFVVPEKFKDTYYAMDYIEWRDPKVERDQKGFDAAYELFDKEVTKTHDIIAVKSPDEGLDAIRDLESWMPKKK